MNRLLAAAVRRERRTPAARLARVSRLVGELDRYGPEPAVVSAASAAGRRTGSPDRDYYVQAAERLGSNRACLAIARKLLKRSYHTLRELGEEALQPA